MTAPTIEAAGEPHVDGNALAGPLSEIFRRDVTTASARCRGCGSVAVLATAMVYATAAGTIVRCGSCASVLATLVECEDGRAWLSMPGITALEFSP